LKFRHFSKQGVFFRKDAFFNALGWGLAVILGFYAHLGYAGCLAPAMDEHVVVQSVVDGDTIRLKNQVLVRLIGINTPEIGYDGAVSQPLARAARDFLATLLDEHKTVGLVYGKDSQDRHGRRLAYVFVNDGEHYRNAQQLLLENGLAMWVAIAPNTRFLECHQAAEEKAEKQRVGLWREAVFRPKIVEQQARLTPGFQLLQGKITSTLNTKNSLWLKFNDTVALRILQKDLQYFQLSELMALEGKTVTARGWVYKHKNRLTMQISHPASIVSQP
jgi:endonuclease YncB( thermonuclease family)